LPRGGRDQDVRRRLGGRQRRRKAVGKGGHQPAGRAPALPGPPPAVPARRAVLHEHAAEPQRCWLRAGRRGDAVTQIRKHARDFAFIVGLVLLALVVGGYVLSQERFTLPRGVPLLGSDFVTYHAAL